MFRGTERVSFVATRVPMGGGGYSKVTTDQKAADLTKNLGGHRVKDKSTLNPVTVEEVRDIKLDLSP